MRMNCAQFYFSPVPSLSRLPPFSVLSFSVDLVYIFRNQITMTPSTGVTDRCPCHRLDRLTDLADKRHRRRRLSLLPRQPADHWSALPLPLRFKLVVLAKIRPDESSRGASPHEYLARHIRVYGTSIMYLRLAPETHLDH